MFKGWIASLPWNKIPALELKLAQNKELLDFNVRKKDSLIEEMFQREVLLGKREDEIEELKMTVIDAVDYLQKEKSKNEELKKIIANKELLEKIAKEVSDKL